MFSDKTGHWVLFHMCLICTILKTDTDLKYTEKYSSWLKRLEMEDRSTKMKHAG